MPAADNPDALTAYVEWTKAALPVWASRGFDPAARRFRERLDLSGAPIDLPHRAMVQARQIFVFADACRRGWYADGGALAEIAMAALIERYAMDHGDRTAFAFSADRSGAIVSDTRDTYAHAFVLFSIASLYRLNGDARLIALADRVIRFIDAEMTDKQYGGLFDALHAANGDKRQNPHMHLLEAYLFLDAAAPGRGYIERAASLVQLFKDRFFKQPGVLLEYFSAHWAPQADPVRATTWEPGHHFEWVWLLDRFARATDTSLESWTTPLHANACRHGIAPDGLVVDEVAADDMRVLKPSRRLWPHTEAIKAAVVRHAVGDAGAIPLARGMAQGLLTTFLDRPFAGGWIDHVDPIGAPLVDYVPASSLYHIYLAATEAADGFKPAGAAQQAA